MKKEFQKYTLEDFLEDADFRAWVNSPKPDPDNDYTDLLKKFPEKREIFNQASYLLRFLDNEKQATPSKVKVQKWNEVLKRYSQKRKKENYRVLFRYAAILLVALSIGSVVWHRISRSYNNVLATTIDLRNYSETTLLLDGDSKYNVAGNQSSIEYLNDRGELSINGKLVQDTLNEPDGQLNQLIVPFGKQSKITLPDKTIVWLNAGSRLLYPSMFDKERRVVYLEGEAFFEVSKNKHKPFILEMHHSQIKVLGTQFNVISYFDEPTDEATLVEGSINLSFNHSTSGKNVILKPEEHIVVNTDQSFSISHVDIRNAISWREGILAFHEESLSAVFKRLSRFYGLEIVCADEDANTNKEISGKLDLKKGYPTVLKSLGVILNGEYLERNGKIIFKLKPDNSD